MSAVAASRGVTLPSAPDTDNTYQPDAFFFNLPPTSSQITKTSTSQTRHDSSERENFYRWRPGYHLMSRNNWVNDPCGPGYSPASRCYHISFQWNPYGWEWGNMSWGHATSQDMVHWTVSREPSMQPSADEDRCGVFTGCTWPTNPKGISDGTITALYTSAQILPIHWRLPYQKGSELIRMATSRDDGRTWKRRPLPIVGNPPDGMDVTGWRDPFVGRWESVDKCLGRSPGENLYGVVAGGIRDKSPTVFLYSIDPHDLAHWSFVDTIFSPGLNFRPSHRLPDFGGNFEVTNFMTIHDNHDQSYDILLMSIEGAVEESDASVTSHKGVERATRSNKIQNWLCGKPKPTTKRSADGSERPSVELEFQFGGRLDHGLYYAANSFHDPISENQLVYGWVLEEDLPPHLTAKQKWSGMLSLPRVLSMGQTRNVVATSCSDLESLDWLHCTPAANGTYDVTALTSSPDPRLSLLRGDEMALDSFSTSNDEGDSDDQMRDFLPVETGHLEADVSLTVPATTEQIGIILYHSEDQTRKTVISFRPNEECMVVERNGAYAPAELDGINDQDEIAPHTLLTTRDPATGKTEQETLDIRLFFDVSVLEIFINERVAITTRIYAESGKCYGLKPFVKHHEGSGGRESPEIVHCRGWKLQPSIVYEM